MHRVFGILAIGLLALLFFGSPVNAFGKISCAKTQGPTDFPTQYTLDPESDWKTRGGQRSLFLSGEKRFQLLPDGRLIVSSFEGQARYKCNTTVAELEIKRKEKKHIGSTYQEGKVYGNQKVYSFNSGSGLGGSKKSNVFKDAEINEIPRNDTSVSPRNQEMAGLKDSQACLNLQDRINGHVSNSEYEKAKNALELMKSMNCQGGSSQLSQSSDSVPVTASAKPKFSSSDLICSAGPLWRPNFGRDTVYFNVRSFDANPRSKCKFAVARCDAYAQAAAHGTQVPKQYRLPDSYSANCQTFGSIIRSTDCKITPNTGGGGFVEGFANGLNQGLITLMAKKNAMVSTFQSCMADEGYSLVAQ